MVQCCVNKTPPLDSLLSQFDLFYTRSPPLLFLNYLFTSRLLCP
jgi:hypothetical protein